jgi:hypothetical protein
MAQRHNSLTPGWLPALDDPSARLSTQQSLTALANGTFFAVDASKQVLMALRDGELVASLELAHMPLCIHVHASDATTSIVLLAHGASLSLVESSEGDLRLVFQADLPYLQHGAEQDLVNQCLAEAAPASALVGFVYEQLSADDGARLSPTGRHLAMLELDGVSDGRATLRATLDRLTEIVAMTVSRAHAAVGQLQAGEGLSALLIVATRDGMLAQIDLGLLLAIGRGEGTGADGRWTLPCRASVVLPAAPPLLIATPPPTSRTGYARVPAGSDPLVPTVAVACADGSLCVVRGTSISAVIGGSLTPRALALSHSLILLVTDGATEDRSVVSCFQLSGQRLWVHEMQASASACVPVGVSASDSLLGELSAIAFAVSRSDGFIEILDGLDRTIDQINQAALGRQHGGGPDSTRAAPTSSGPSSSAAAAPHTAATAAAAHSDGNSNGGALSLGRCLTISVVDGLAKNSRAPDGGPLDGEPASSTSIVSVQFGSYSKEEHALVCVSGDGALHVRILSR